MLVSPEYPKRSATALPLENLRAVYLDIPDSHETQAFIWVSQNSEKAQEYTCAGVFFLIKL